MRLRRLLLAAVQLDGVVLDLLTQLLQALLLLRVVLLQLVELRVQLQMAHAFNENRSGSAVYAIRRIPTIFDVESAGLFYIG